MTEKIKSYFKISDKRRPIFDFMRVFSCLAVIGIHVTGDRGDLKGLIMENAFRIGLPMFFIMSGLLNVTKEHEEPLGQYYQKTFKKLVLPFFIYALYYTGWLFQGQKILAVPTWDAVRNFIRLIPAGLSANVTKYQSVHLWFMYEIIGIYVILPFLRKGLRAMDDKMLKGLAAAMIVMMALADYLPAFGQGFGFSNYFNHWAIYIALGYILMQEFSARNYKWIALLGGCAYIGSIWLRIAHASFAGKIFNYYDLAPHMIFQTCGVFALFMLSEKWLTHFKTLNWIMYKLGKYTFAIYLIHAYILQWWVDSFGNSNTTIHGTLGIVLGVFGLSLIFGIIFDNIVTFNIQRLFDIICKWICNFFKKYICKTKKINNL